MDSTKEKHKSGRALKEIKEMRIYPHMPFHQAKGWVEINTEQEGACICPCCGQKVTKKERVKPPANDLFLDL